MIRLVVNADDGGIDGGRNRGILRAIQEGIVTSVSILAGLPDSEALLEALRIARTAGGSHPGIGLHLNLTAGMPLASGSSSLTDRQGAFHPKAELWRRALDGRIDVRDVRREVAAQWAWLERRGLRPDHLDGHNHSQVLPGIAEVLPDVLPRGTWVRLPWEAAPVPGAIETGLPALLEDPPVFIGALAELSRRAASAWAGRLRSAPRFAGCRLLPGYTVTGVLETLARCLERRQDWKEGIEGDGPCILELMVHPGEIDDHSVPFSAEPARQKELEVLCAPEVREFLVRREVQLVSFGELR